MKRITKLLFSLLLFSLIFNLGIGCERDTVPNGIISKKELAQIIVDIHVAEAVYNQGIGAYRRMEPEALRYYKSVIDKYGVTKELLDTTIAWYSNHPKVYLMVYDKVIAALSEKEAFTESELSKFLAEEKEKKESQISNLWKEKSEYSLKGKDTFDTNLPFKIKIDSLFGGRLMLSASYTFKKEDISSKNEIFMISCYTDSIRDTITSDIEKSFSKRKGMLSYELKDTLYLISVEGYLFKHQSDIEPYVEIEKINLQYIPKTDTTHFE